METLSKSIHNDFRLKMRIQLLEDNTQLLRLITKYDCKPSDIAEVIRLNGYDPVQGHPITDIKLKPKKNNILDKIKRWFND
jgi:hypothetical protein